MIFDAINRRSVAKALDNSSLAAAGPKAPSPQKRHKDNTVPKNCYTTPVANQTTVSQNMSEQHRKVFWNSM